MKVQVLNLLVHLFYHDTHQAFLSIHSSSMDVEDNAEDWFSSASSLVSASSPSFVALLETFPGKSSSDDSSALLVCSVASLRSVPLLLVRSLSLVLLCSIFFVLDSAVGLEAYPLEAVPLGLGVDVRLGFLFG
uniref:Uncharacterized protein n=1 Tax=Arundo donax TaxID=35708 RepID=A0A0A9ER95_ARUDO